MKIIEFDTSKKFNKLFIKKPSFMSYIDLRNAPKGYYGNIDYLIAQTNQLQSLHSMEYERYPVYPAYTLDEILDMLPKILRIKKYVYYLEMATNPAGYSFCYMEFADDILEKSHLNKNPAEAAAQLLIWCIENNYITIKEIDNELSVL